jgi:hypothetical protein
MTPGAYANAHELAASQLDCKEVVQTQKLAGSEADRFGTIEFAVQRLKY